MQSLIKFAAVALVAVGVAACGPMIAQHPLEEARAMQVAGTGFDQALTGDYIALSEVEYGQGDMRDGGAYAARARIQAQGQTLLPEEVEARPFLAAAYKPELTAARQRLVAALNGNARESTPRDAATSATVARVATVTRCSGVVPFSMTATGSSAERPPACSSSAISARRETPMRKTSVPSSAAIDGKSSGPSCPETTVKRLVIPRAVTGIPAAAGAASALVIPGTTVTSTPAARQAAASSLPRPST